jgi:hypothetical protein
MAQRKVWLGSTGPFLYDDEIFYIDPDYGPSAELQKAILTDGQITVGLPPTQSTHVVRKYELDTFAASLGLGTMAYQNHSAVNITGGSIVGLSALSANCVSYAYAFSVITDFDSPAFYTTRNAGGGRFGINCAGTAPSQFNGNVTVNPAVFSGSFQVTTDLDAPAFYTTRNAGGGRYAFFSNGTAPCYIGGTLTVIGNSIFSSNTKVTGSLGVSAEPVAGFSLVTGSAPAYIGGKMGLGVNPALEVLDVSGHFYSRGNIGVRVRPVDHAGIYIVHDKTTRSAIILAAAVANTGNQPILFLNTSLVSVGNIDTTATATLYNTTSDSRLKESIVPLTNALDCIRSLNPISHKWKIDGSQGYGFAADELQKIRPECVTGEPDALNEDGTIKPQQVDYSKLVPWLVAAIKELSERN